VIGTALRHYRIVDALGAGGMGVVYRAHDERLDRDVALKLLPAGALADEDSRRRFHREALALSRLSHPGIATIFTFEADQGLDFLVMECVEGRTLETVLADGPLSERDVRDLGGQIAEALAAAHEQGVLHRDLKPANIVVTPHGQVKVLDFGLARLLGGDERAAVPATVGRLVAGTLPYMAPERLLGAESGIAADLYALGAVLFEMTTGRAPHRAEPATALVYEIVNAPAPRAASLRPGVSASLDTLIARLLEKDPAARPPDAGAVYEALVAKPDEPAAPTAGEPLRSLVVLPLDHLSRDPADEFLADGMTGTLIAELARLHGLRVISRTSAMSYKGTRRPLPEIARALRVDAVVEGTVQRVGERLSVSVRLVEAATERTLWSERYDRPLTDVLTLQLEVAGAIAEGVRLSLTPREHAHLSVPRAVSPRAWEHYVRGRHFWEQRTPEAVTRALASFQQAIDEDPAWPLAWTGVADCHNVRGAFRWMGSAATFPLGKAAALRALELDPGLGEAHCSLAFALLYHEWNWDAAGRAFMRSLELQPGYATARQWYAEYLVSLARFEQARAEAARAAALDPLSWVIANTVGDIHYYSRHFDDAVRQYQRAIELAPHAALTQLNLARTYEALERHDEAVAGMRRGVEMSGQDPDASPAVAHTLAVAGRHDEARRVLARVLPRSEAGQVSPYSVATVYAGLGERDQAFAWLDRALEDRDRMMVQALVHPRLDPLRGDPRFDRVLHRVGLGR
jgi:serine/threonine-protein kinase